MGISHNAITQWHHTGLAVRICGHDLVPTPHPFMQDEVLKITRSQGTVYFLKDLSGETWLIKCFRSGQQLSEAYLNQVSQLVPGTLAFFTVCQRRILSTDHFDWRASRYRDPELSRILQGAVIMPAVKGRSFSAVSEARRHGSETWSHERSLRAASRLVQVVQDLERHRCSHRDLSNSNVFIDANDQIRLIDCDGLYHPTLDQPASLTLGTDGYLPSFLLNSKHVHTSWHPKADRFALGILITELLLTQKGQPAKEDGAFFSQKALQHGDASLKSSIGMISSLDRRLGQLLTSTLEAQSFDACPSPLEWLAALNSVVRRKTSCDTPMLSLRCRDCGQSFQLSSVQVKRVQRRGHELLCPSCLKKQLSHVHEKKARNDHLAPQVLCEHCGHQTRVQRDKLNQLRLDGKPILCGSCLTKQMAHWTLEKATRDQNYPQVHCHDCTSPFRISAHKRDKLLAAGRRLLCPRCRRDLERKREATRHAKSLIS